MQEIRLSKKDLAEGLKITVTDFKDNPFSVIINSDTTTVSGKNWSEEINNRRISNDR